jgi:hypothetical protein
MAGLASTKDMKVFMLSNHTEKRLTPRLHSLKDIDDMNKKMGYDLKRLQLPI